MNARVGPTLFPAIQIRLRLFQTFKAQALERCLLRMADAGLDLPFSIRIAHAARQRDYAVVLQHIAKERVDLRIVNVRRQHAFTQIV